MKVLVTEQLGPHRYKDNHGYLICTDCIMARTGKQTYTRDDCFGDGDMTQIEVDRKEKDVFDPKTLASFENVPITIEHPQSNVDPDNYSSLSVGYMRDIHKGTYEGKPVMMGTAVLTDATGIEKVESGELTNLSCGYDCDVDSSDSPCQTNIRGNHIALCEVPRAGITHIQDSVKDEHTSLFELMYEVNGERKTLMFSDKESAMKYAKSIKNMTVGSFHYTIREVDGDNGFEPIGGKEMNSKDSMKDYDELKPRKFICFYKGWNIYFDNGIYYGRHDEKTPYYAPIDDLAYTNIEGVKKQINNFWRKTQDPYYLQTNVGSTPDKMYTPDSFSNCKDLAKDAIAIGKYSREFNFDTGAEARSFGNSCANMYKIKFENLHFSDYGEGQYLTFAGPIENLKKMIIDLSGNKEEADNEIKKIKEIGTMDEKTVNDIYMKDSDWDRYDLPEGYYIEYKRMSPSQSYWLYTTFEGYPYGDRLYFSDDGSFTSAFDNLSDKVQSAIMKFYHNIVKSDYRDLDKAASVDDDIVKTKKGWANKGREGTHGHFTTKKAAREQQKAMFARGYKGDAMKDDGYIKFSEEFSLPEDIFYDQNVKKAIEANTSFKVNVKEDEDYEDDGYVLFEIVGNSLDENFEKDKKMVEDFIRRKNARYNTAVHRKWIAAPRNILAKDANYSVEQEGSRYNIKNKEGKTIVTSVDREKAMNNLSNLSQGKPIEDEDEMHICVICGKHFRGYPNNAKPVEEGYCCDECNKKYVIPARLRQMKRDSEDEYIVEADDAREAMRLVKQAKRMK